MASPTLMRKATKIMHILRLPVQLHRTTSKHRTSIRASSQGNPGTRSSSLGRMRRPFRLIRVKLTVTCRCHPKPNARSARRRMWILSSDRVVTCSTSAASSRVSRRPWVPPSALATIFPCSRHSWRFLPTVSLCRHNSSSKIYSRSNRGCIQVPSPFPPKTRGRKLLEEYATLLVSVHRRIKSLGSIATVLSHQTQQYQYLQ